MAGNQEGRRVSSPQSIWEQERVGSVSLCPRGELCRGAGGEACFGEGTKTGELGRVTVDNG